MNAGRVSPSVALAAYAEAWISGSKVVLFGDALSSLPERLIERGARHVQVYDADPARAAEASAASTLKQVSYAPLDLAGSSIRDGVFDLAIVEDLAVAGDNPKGLLGMLVRTLARRGLALIGARNPDVSERLIPCAIPTAVALGYYDFYDVVSQHFEEVRMLGQTPFVGYAIADFSAADASDVRIDTALLPGGAEEPEWFLALASALPVSPDAFSVIQLPLADLELGSGSDRTAVDPEALERAEQAEGKIQELEAALAALAAEGAREAEKHSAERARDAERFAAERARELEKLAAERARDAEKLAAERARDAEKLAAQKVAAERLTAERVRDAERLTAERARDAERQQSERFAAERTRDAERLAAERSREGEKEKQTRERSREAEKRELDKLEKTYVEKLRALTAELQKREEWLTGLESRAATADERADAAQAELEQRAAEQRKLEQQLARLEQQLEEERRAKRQLEQSTRAHEQELEKNLDQSKRRAEKETERASELAAEAKKLAARVAELTSALAASEKKAKQNAEEGDEEVRAELTQLEGSLKERAVEVSRLTAALHETERFGRQLIVKISELEARVEPAQQSAEVEQLTQRNAELAADLEAARWTISSLEANVGADPSGSPASDGSLSGMGTAGPRRDDIPPTEPLPAPRAD
jgi:hypothetical protein